MPPGYSILFKLLVKESKSGDFIVTATFCPRNALLLSNLVLVDFVLYSLLEVAPTTLACSTNISHEVSVMV